MKISYMCYRCFTVHTKDELVFNEKKLKNLSKEASGQFKKCRVCNCRTFLRMA